MTVTLTEEKTQKLMDLIDDILRQQTITIRLIARLIGKMVSSLPASLYGALYYRSIECDKNIIKGIIQQLYKETCEVE